MLCPPNIRVCGNSAISVPTVGWDTPHDSKPASSWRMGASQSAHDLVEAVVRLEKEQIPATGTAAAVNSWRCPLYLSLSLAGWLVVLLAGWLALCVCDDR